MYEQSHRDYLRLWLSASSSAWVAKPLIVIGDNAITYKVQRDKNAREKLANAAITDMQMRQRDVVALDANTS